MGAAKKNVFSRSLRVLFMFLVITFHFHTDFDANSCPHDREQMDFIGFSALSGTESQPVALTAALDSVPSSTPLWSGVFYHLPVTALVSRACLQSSDCYWSSPAGQEARRTWTPPRACFATSTLMETRRPTRLKPGIRPVRRKEQSQ